VGRELVWIPSVKSALSHKVASVDPRLRPLNAVLALVNKDGAWFDDLADQGFRLHAIELKVQSSAGIVVADAVIYRQSPELVLLCEGKSGRSMEEEQARKYTAADAAALRRGGSLPVALSTDAVVCPLFVVMNDVRSDVEAALQGFGIEAPVLSIDRGFARLDGPCPDGLEPFLRTTPAGPKRWPPARVRVDHQSPLEELVELLAQQIVAAQAKRQPVLDLAEAASRIYRQWPALSQSGRRDFLRRLRDCARHLAKGSLKDTIRVEPGSNNVAPKIVIERTPADLDTRGMPQAWQGQARHMAADLGRGGGPPPDEEKQLSLDDLDLGESEDPDT
jgi:hypothetical protein